MAEDDAWRVLIRPQGYTETTLEPAPTSLEHSAWTVFTKSIPYAPQITLTEDTKIVGALTAATANDERLISREYKLLDRNWILRFGAKTTASAVTISSKFGIVSKPGKWNDSVAGTTPSTMSVAFIGVDGISTETRIDTIDMFGVQDTSAAITALANNTTYFFQFERTAALTLKLSVFTDSSFSTHLAGSPITFVLAGTRVFNKMNSMQFGSFNDGTAGTLTTELTDIELSPKEFLNINQASVSNVMDMTLNISRNESKSFKFKFDDSSDLLKDVDIGDEVLVWMDNEADGLIFSTDMETRDGDDTGQRNLYDISGLGLKGVRSAADPVPKQGKVEYTIGYIGGGHRHDFGSKRQLNPTTGITIACWFEVDAGFLATQMRLVSKWTGVNATSSYLLRSIDLAPAPDAPTFYISDGTNTDSVSSPNAPIADTFIHFVATYDAATKVFKLYENGIQVATKTSVVLGTSIKGTNTAFVLGGEPGGTESHNGGVDEVFLYDRALSASEIKSVFDRSGRCPKLYFKGLIQDITKNNQMIEISAVDEFSELMDYELYDAIYEGQGLPSTKGGTNDKVAFTDRHLDLSVATIDGAAGTRFSALVDIDGSSLNNSLFAIEDIVIGRNKGAIVWQAELVGGDQVVSSTRSVGMAFIAHDDTITDVYVPCDYDLAGGNVVTLEITGNLPSTVVGNSDEPDTATILGTATFTGPTAAVGFEFHKFTFGAAVTGLIVGGKYWVRLTSNFANSFPAEPYFRVERDADYETDNELFINDAGTRTFKKDIIPAKSVIFGDPILAIDEIDNDDFDIKFDSTEGWVVAWRDDYMTQEGKIDPDFQLGVVIAYYIYSKNSLTLKHVIERLLRKSRNLKGLYTGRISTQKMGAFFPQGGSIYKHITDLANMSDSQVLNKIAGYVSVEDIIRRSTLRNGTMEANEGWSYWRNSTEGTNLGYVSAVGDAKTGTRAYRVRFDSGVALEIGDQMGIYQDIDLWSNGDISLWYKTSEVNANLNVKVYREPYGGGAQTLLESRSTAVAYTQLITLSNIKEARFRLVIVLEANAIFTPGANITLTIDDVYQTVSWGGLFYGIKDGFATEVGHVPDQKTLIDITSLDRDSELERLTNMSIQINAQRDTQIGDAALPVVAAKNVRFYDLFGPKVSFRSAGRARKLKDMYLLIKSQLEFRYSDSLNISLATQAPYLFGKAILILYPDAGINEWTLYNIDSVQVGLDKTKITSSELRFADTNMTEKIKEKEDEQRTRGGPLSNKYTYFIAMDCQTSAGTLGTMKDLQISDGTTTLTSKKFTSPEAGVYIFDFKRRDSPTLANFAADRYFKTLTIRNSTAQTIGSAVIPWGWRFVKTKNVLLSIVLFDRRILLGIN